MNLDDHLLIAGLEDSLLCSYRVFAQGFVLCYRPLLKQTTGLSESLEGQHGTTAGSRALMRVKRLKLKEVAIEFSLTCHSLLLHTVCVM